ncbi:hypothetical protein M0R36_11215 [bacterium]|nr:hypothetical protein [bacterium]
MERLKVKLCLMHIQNICNQVSKNYGIPNLVIKDAKFEFFNILNKIYIRSLLIQVITDRAFSTVKYENELKKLFKGRLFVDIHFDIRPRRDVIKIGHETKTYYFSFLKSRNFLSVPILEKIK